MFYRFCLTHKIESYERFLQRFIEVYVIILADFDQICYVNTYIIIFKFYY